MRYLLDTNIVSDVMRNPQGPVAGRLENAGDTHICASVIVAAEILKDYLEWRGNLINHDSERITN